MRIGTALCIVYLLSGCSAGVLAGISAAASIASAAHSFYQVSGDIITATSLACQRWAVAKALHPTEAAKVDPWYSKIYSNISPNNTAINHSTAALIGAGAGRLGITK